MSKLSAAAAASCFALGLSLSAHAQTAATGTASGYKGDDISVGTYGAGTSSPTTVGVTGGAEATAADGGTATSDSTGRRINILNMFVVVIDSH